MVYESASEFEKHMNRGDIVDYSPYLQKPSKYEDHLHSMAVNGVCIDELVALHDEDLTLEIIMNGYGQKYYEEWAKTGNQIIQFAMALMDCCPEILINSPYGEVRLEVAKQHPEYTSLVIGFGEVFTSSLFEVSYNVEQGKIPFLKIEKQK